MNQTSRSIAMGNGRVFRFLSYALVFLIMACFVMTLSILIRSTLPEWHSGIIAGTALLVLTERLYTYRQFKSLTILTAEWAIAFGAQWLVILLVTRLLLAYANGLDSFREELSLFARGYLEKFFTPELVISLMLASLVWVLTRQFLDLIDEIGLDQAAALSEEQVLPAQEVPAHQRMVNLVFILGIVLVILTAMTRMNLRSILLSPGRIPTVEFSRFSGAEAGALLYFVFGLALLSLSRLMSLQTHWNRERIPISSRNLTRQWAVYSLVFLLGLALIVNLLPAGDSLGLFPLLWTLFGYLFQVLLFIIELFIGLLLLILSLPFLLFDQPPPILVPSEPPPMPVMPPAPSPLPVTGNEVWAMVRSIFLWGTLLVIVVFAFIQFTRQHGGILPALRRSRLTNWLLLAWQWLSKNVDTTRGNLSRAIADGWQYIVARREGKRLLPRPGWISVRSLEPRQRIYFFYLALIRRGAEDGVGRRLSQTPSEYAVTLEQALPSAEEDIKSMTQAFMEARYSRHDVNASDADQVKAAWGRIRRALQEQFKKDR